MFIFNDSLSFLFESACLTFENCLYLFETRLEIIIANVVCYLDIGNIPGNVIKLVCTITTQHGNTGAATTDVRK